MEHHRDFFGLSVAISNDTAIVAAREHDSNSIERSGAAYIFTRSSTNWTQQTKLVAGDSARFNRFGSSVDISGDLAIIGAHGNGSTPDLDSAYTFTRSGPNWSQVTKLTASDEAIGNGFGISVAISGSTVIVGAYADNANGSNSGAAYVKKLD